LTYPRGRVTPAPPKGRITRTDRPSTLVFGDPTEEKTGRSAVEEREPPRSLVLAATGIRKSFPHRNGRRAVLAGVSCHLPAGGWVSVIGPSGCGKTTLLRILAGLIAPDSGRVVTGETGGQRSIAYMPQTDTLFPWRTALENAILGSEVDGRARGEARKEARRLFLRFGLGGSENLYPSQLSGGMRQRLSLMRTFLCHREVLLLDEPLGSLDALTRTMMQDWLLSVWKDLGHSVVLVTHDIKEAILLSDHVYVLSERPACVRGEFALDQPRPRSRAADSVVRLEAEILELIGSPGREGSHS